MSRPPLPEPPAEEFNSKADMESSLPPYSKVDDTTVLEQKKAVIGKKYEVLKYRPVEAMLNTIYDFKACQVQIFMTKDTAVVGAPVVMNFADVEGKQGIVEAHAELIKLGGHPPELEEVLTGLLNKKSREPKLSP